ncbi:IS3 family transposase [Arthrobacter psychrolactophilus]
MPWQKPSIHFSRLSWSGTKDRWTGINDLEIAVSEYIDWYNHRRLHGEIGYIPPVEAEANYYSNLPVIKTMERV